MSSSKPAVGGSQLDTDKRTYDRRPHVSWSVGCRRGRTGPKVLHGKQLSPSQALFSQVDGFVPPVRVGNQALGMQRLHEGKVIALSDTAVFELENPEQESVPLFCLRRSS